MTLIKKFSRFLTDLHSQLLENYREYYNSKIYPIRAVYRRQYLSDDEVQYLRPVCKSTNSVIKLTTFTSASLDPEIAMNFIPSSDDRIPCLFEIIITDEYKIEESDAWDDTQTFANISSLSEMPEEQEVLFSLLTHFRVKDVGDLIIQRDGRWVPITLQLINAKTTNYAYIVS
ncbi:unnamed protein product [Didymodactylos carnosus]|uniref:Uncharacterized protein n=1 Tax=Didymodactylos carnosus TaxID=1234261 RepID=A0A814XVP5_9BILA|nr:unnamed protein product [Didymodactylos carnosus]CAF3984273.1 unnamed protein product [Didymodactylos carnosus]